MVALLKQVASHPLNSDKVAVVAESLGNTTGNRVLYTPWKRRKLEKMVEASPSELMTSFQDITYVPVIDDLGAPEQPDVVLSNLAGGWPGLVRNLTTLHEMAAGTKKANKEISTVVEEELEALSTQLLLLSSRVGDRPERA
jgi:hypothetical protein